eukprot:TRINITY_DN13308_c0_g1_i1.p1 TRINITY_DN13308_c0_g1~~TRINITY_DN13308_c0_g1_i1.p1  ORF type:complete len:199 (-),score=22.92 TRINITY_DN13308_c0_g1_i1:35-631(-)
MSRSNWLSFSLPSPVRDALYEVAKGIAEDAIDVLGPDITFRNMEHSDIHMTGLFIGDGLHSLKFAQLSRFHTLCSQAPTKKEMKLKFIGFSLFPPGKNNLIVAKFEADQDLYEYAEHLLLSAEAVGLQGLREKHNLEPHVTLGKIQGTRAQVGCLSKHGGPQIPDLALVAKEWTTNGSYLCGKIPQQAFLDWTFEISK